MFRFPPVTELRFAPWRGGRRSIDEIRVRDSFRLPAGALSGYVLKRRHRMIIRWLHHRFGGLGKVLASTRSLPDHTPGVHYYARDFINCRFRSDCFGRIRQFMGIACGFEMGFSACGAGAFRLHSASAKVFVSRCWMKKRHHAVIVRTG